MMRQYELVERVRKYNPQRRRGSAQPRLCLRHEGAWRAEARLRRSLFLASARSRGDPHRSEARRRDHRRRRAARHDRRHRARRARRSTGCSAREIGKLVDGLTKIDKLDLVSKQARQGENFRKLLLAVADDVRVLLVKLADRLHNMRTLHFVPPEKRARIAQETLDIYAPLAGRMGMQRLREELEDLAFRHLMPEALSDHRARACTICAPRTARIIKRIEEELTERVRARAASRPRSRGARRRLIRSGARWSANRSPSSSFPTSSAFASSSATVEDCYRALGVVHTKWPSVPGRFKDYISTPKQNDYRSIHTTVIGPGHQRVELQIRTAEMHEIARFGIAAHALYKDATGAGGPRASSPRKAAPIAGCRRRSNCWRMATVPRNFSSTRGSSCSRTRCSASRPRAG